MQIYHLSLCSKLWQIATVVKDACGNDEQIMEALFRRGKEMCSDRLAFFSGCEDYLKRFQQDRCAQKEIQHKKNLPGLTRARRPKKCGPPIPRAKTKESDCSTDTDADEDYGV